MSHQEPSCRGRPARCGAPQVRRRALPVASLAAEHEAAQARQSKLNPHRDDDQTHEAADGITGKASTSGTAGTTPHAGNENDHDPHGQHRHGDGEQRGDRKFGSAMGDGQGDDAGNRAGTGGEDDQWCQRTAAGLAISGVAMSVASCRGLFALRVTGEHRKADPRQHAATGYRKGIERDAEEVQDAYAEERRQNENHQHGQGRPGRVGELSLPRLLVLDAREQSATHQWIHQRQHSDHRL